MIIPFDPTQQRRAIEARLIDLNAQLATLEDRRDKLIEERRDLDVMLRSLPEVRT